jgi:hypothetical protein
MALQSTVGPMTFALKLIKEIFQRPAARKSGRLIGGEAATFDPHAHGFAASDNSPAPRRRVGDHPGCQYVIAPMVQFPNHSLRIIVDDG